MAVYINGSSCISLQNSYNGNINEFVKLNGNVLKCIEPNYNTILDVKMLRRMSRVIKMGMATAVNSLKQAQLTSVDAIITGTGLGCIEDTGNFLSRLSNNNDRMMNPTAFIQSTHNTVGSQIALNLGINGYNATYSHLNTSFENALLDAYLTIKHKEVENLLVGAFDELTPDLHAIYNRLGLFNENLTAHNEFIAGEGCSFFALSGSENSNSIAKIEEVQILYKPSDIELTNAFNKISCHSSLILHGKNGNEKNNEDYKLFDALLANIMQYPYKELCGEYYTSSAFALWYAVKLLTETNQFNNNINKVYIYNCNQYYHSIICISKY